MTFFKNLPKYGRVSGARPYSKLNRRKSDAMIAHQTLAGPTGGKPWEKEGPGDGSFIKKTEREEKSVGRGPSQ